VQYYQGREPGGLVVKRSNDFIPRWSGEKEEVEAKLHRKNLFLGSFWGRSKAETGGRTFLPHLLTLKEP